MSKNIFKNYNNKQFKKSSIMNNPLQNESKNDNQINWKEIDDSLENIIKGKEIKEYIPSKLRKNQKPEKVENMILNIGSKELVPKIDILMNKKEEKEKAKPENKEYIFSYEFLIKFKITEICNNTDLLFTETLNHLKDMEEKLEEMQKIKNNNFDCKNSKINRYKNESCSLAQWGRKDYTKEINIAEQNIKKFTEIDKENNTIRELRALTNIMTKDNYEAIKPQIINILKEDVKIQEQYLEIYIKKALEGKLYIELYGKLCRDLNKELPQKSKENKKTNNPSSIFRNLVIDKIKENMKAKNFDEYFKEENPEERKQRLMKFYLSNIDFLFELIKIKMLSKKIIPDVANFLFNQYENDKEKFMKIIYARAIISFIGGVGELIYKENKKIKKEDAKQLKKELEVFFENLKKLQNDNSLPQNIKYLIINLLEKKKNNYEESLFEKSLKAKSKKELEEEEIKEKKEKEQETINEKIKNDLNEYKEYVEEEGNSKKYSWNTITILYDKEFKSLDDILEGYIISSADFIDNKNTNNIKYAKDYFKELIQFYHKLISDNEKKDLQKRAINLFNLVKDFAYETPKIYDVYAYVLFIFINYNIMNIEDLENIFTKEPDESDISVLNQIFKNIYDYNKSASFKKELKKFGFIYKNKGLFDWIF